jgi:hypothetical protein
MSATPAPVSASVDAVGETDCVSAAVTAILALSSDADLATVAQVVKDRRTELSMRLEIGRTVRIDGISPKYLNGLTGRVSDIQRGTGKPIATVTLDVASTARLRAVGRRTFIAPQEQNHPLGGIPLVCCKPID